MTIKHGLGEGHTTSFIDGELRARHAPPLHVHEKEDESFYVLSGLIRFRHGTDEFDAGPGDYVFVSCCSPHTFKIRSNGARMIMMSTSPLLARFMAAGGRPAWGSHLHEVSDTDLERVVELSASYDMRVVGPPLQ
jgi:quercetin dioxygenase-like cupin family protein